MRARQLSGGFDPGALPAERTTRPFAARTEVSRRSIALVTSGRCTSAAKPYARRSVAAVVIVTLCAVLLSYACVDAETAERIAAVLGVAATEVGASEPGGREAWKRRIREETGACSLFIPVVAFVDKFLTHAAR